MSVRKDATQAGIRSLAIGFTSLQHGVCVQVGFFGFLLVGAVLITQNDGY